MGHYRNESAYCKYEIGTKQRIGMMTLLGIENVSNMGHYRDESTYCKYEIGTKQRIGMTTLSYLDVPKYKLE